MKKGGIAALVLLLAAGAGGGWYYYKNYYQGASAPAEDGSGIYMESVRRIMDQGAAGFTERYTGLVDTQETKSINLDSAKTLKDIFVEVGDEVKKGTPLFSYDTDEMDQKIKEAELALEEEQYSLENMNQQLAQLQAKAAKAKPEEQQAYNLEILSAQNAIKRQEYNISLKQLEKAQLEKDLTEAVVYADMDGIIQSLNKNGDTGGYSDYGSSGNAFMTILATGDYRIKGTCNEMNVWNLSVGEPMLIRPRADESLTYRGVITKIDTEAATDTNQNSYYGGDSGQSSSKYHFYVSIEDRMDMLLGQHVIMEPDLGQGEAKEGLWIPSYYVVTEEAGTYVWSADEKNRTVKKAVEVGETDDDLMECQILSGLGTLDYVAFPDESLTEGSPVILPE